jgi:signal transduction histidine kinase
MTMLSSLRSRIFLTSALLAVLSIGTAIYLVSVRVTRELENSLRRDMQSTGTLVEQLRATRTQTFTTMARLIADAPKLKASVDTNDPPTVQDNANDYQHQLNSNLLLVTNRTGQLLATVGTTPREALIASLPAIKNAIAGHESISLIPQPDGILHLATVPIAVGVSRPDILGTLSVGFLLDDAFADQLKQITGSDIAIGMDGQVLASTLPRSDRTALSGLLGSAATPQNVRLGSEEYVVLPLRLSAQANQTSPTTNPVALILRSRTEQRRFLQAIHTELAGTAVVAVLLATLLSFAVARTITRPLAAITGVMREVAATGDLTRKITLRSGQRWDDEDARILATTFNTLTDSVARAQQEMSQRERLSSLGRLSTVIAHEVRNPLMIIKAALHALRRSDVTPDATREAAADIDGEVVRLNRLVNEVLDFARPIRFELAAADVNVICRESAAAAQAGPGARIEVRLDLSILPMRTDPERLRVALVNLMVNARHAVDERATPVVLSTARRGQTVSIVVADQGVGIDRVDLPRIFDPYFTTKRGGTGLGLPIAKTIVEGLGGTITVTSEPARGTEIVIALPYNPAEGGSRDAALDVPPPSSSNISAT